MNQLVIILPAVVVFLSFLQASTNQQFYDYKYQVYDQTPSILEHEVSVYITGPGSMSLDGAGV
ncbi:MAG TPA: hypothetical protein PLI50_05840 [bacterium]|nr:hypothetical protein [bacterium]